MAVKVREFCFEEMYCPPLKSFEIMQLCGNILTFNNVMCISWFVISVFRIAPLCHPLLTMQSVCAVFVALAAASLSSADPDMHRPRHDSNLEICILLLSVWRAAAKCTGTPVDMNVSARVCVCV